MHVANGARSDVEYAPLPDAAKCLENRDKTSAALQGDVRHRAARGRDVGEPPRLELHADFELAVERGERDGAAVRACPPRPAVRVADDGRLESVIDALARDGRRRVAVDRN